MHTLLRAITLFFVLGCVFALLLGSLPEPASLYFSLPILAVLCFLGWKHLRGTLDEVAFHDVSDALGHETQDRITRL
jgi:cobalamin synthase